MGILFSKQEKLTLIIRKIQLTDFHEQYLDLLSNLYENIHSNSYPFPNIEEFYNNLNDKHVVLVIEDPEENLIVGTGTVLIEPKIMHNFGLVGHIEDIVVHPEYRNLGIGKVIVEKLVAYAKINNCYKCILDCTNDKIPFYEKCNFSNDSTQMSYYFNSSNL
uniref:N-acetyltransferase domain-containing protein n=1 Tax=viral metagenome TaxID=1070528 RepID=A0A6C0F832_9ZZZZ|tara:strand:+ start:34327 stop:34812 length:486 start_codon:yes stop_codon:yes gene_type:complete